MAENSINTVSAAYGSDMVDDGREDSFTLGIGQRRMVIYGHHDIMPSFDDLGTDELAHIFGFLPPKDIMLARLNKQMREAAKKTIVPMTDFEVGSVEKYNAMVAMTTALPNLQEITLGSFLDDDDDDEDKYSDGETDESRAVQNANWTTHEFDVISNLRKLRNLKIRAADKYVDGEDPNEDWGSITADCITHEIDIIANFTRLRDLKIFMAPLNGRYPFLFNFPLLQKLSITGCTYLKWDLEMLEGLPLLKELHFTFHHLLTGNINSLRVLKDTLTKVMISNCWHVEGNFMVLADFPCLKALELLFTDVTGDIREIGENDFLALKQLTLPSGVYGGTGYELQRISDAPDVISTLYSIKKQRPILLKDWYGQLSEDSPDWYEGFEDSVDTPPFYIRFVQAGSRVGYRWETYNDNPCEMNWLYPEPAKESSEYEKYVEELHEIEEQVDIYRGFYQPPTE